MLTTAIVVGVLALGIGFVIGHQIAIRGRRSQAAVLEARAQERLNEAQAHAEAQQHAFATEKEDFHRQSEETKRQLRRTRKKLDQRLEKLNRRASRLAERETALDKAADALEALKKEADRQRGVIEHMRRSAEVLYSDAEKRNEALDALRDQLDTDRADVQTQLDEVELLKKQQARRLEEISGVSREDALHRLIEQMTEEAKLSAAQSIKEIRDEAKLTANRQARKHILTAIQRMAAVHTIENTVSVVNLESDDMKGRIIGREGRNIRAFEAATGIEVIVDDTPEAVILTGFDPVRREVARIALTKLIADGRIHPARIEEVVDKVRQDIEEEVIETGERTIIDLGLHQMHPELVRLVGRMRYRTSYGQNLLAHSTEVAKIASLMASELGLDARKARRAALLHDIGKVVEEDLESPHAIVGMELCRKHKEHPDICNAVGAHHDEIEMTTPISPIVQAADAISGARPGARREALESYIKRLEKLEETARTFDGVERVYAIQAGRELRVIVNHSLISDAQADQLAADLSKKIENEMQYPGQIRVTVIREVRAVAYAK